MDEDREEEDDDVEEEEGEEFDEGGGEEDMESMLLPPPAALLLSLSLSSSPSLRIVEARVSCILPATSPVPAAAGVAVVKQGCC